MSQVTRSLVALPFGLDKFPSPTATPKTQDRLLRLVWLILCAAGETRTLTGLLPMAFEATTSTDSVTAADV